MNVVSPSFSNRLGALRGAGRSARRAVAVAAAVSGLAATAFVSAPSAFAATTARHPILAQHELVLLNQERAAHHLPALRMKTALINSAYQHNVDMAAHNTMSHQLPGEKSLGSRIDAAHYNWCTAGENVGYTSDMTGPGARVLERIMYNEKAPNDGHRLNILSKSFQDVGISIVTDSAHHRLWLTVDFGHLM
jgi:uncharacterized protein YkwD